MLNFLVKGVIKMGIFAKIFGKSSKDGNGQGTKTLANGDKYVGEFKDGKFIG